MTNIHFLVFLILCVFLLKVKRTCSIICTINWTSKCPALYSELAIVIASLMTRHYADSPPASGCGGDRSTGRQPGGGGPFFHNAPLKSGGAEFSPLVVRSYRKTKQTSALEYYSPKITMESPPPGAAVSYSMYLVLPADYITLHYNTIRRYLYSKVLMGIYH
jgi:hypothetical protein